MLSMKRQRNIKKQKVCGFMLAFTERQDSLMNCFPVGGLCYPYSLSTNVTVHQVNLSLYNAKRSAIGKRYHVANGKTTNQTATDD